MINYLLPQEVHVSIKIYNIAGEEVAALVNDVQTEGSHQIAFDGKNLASGVYFVRMDAGQFTSLIKMNLLR